MDKQDTLPPLPMTPRQVAEVYNMQYQKVLNEIQKGRLNARHKKGEQRKWYITQKDVEQWIEKGMWE